MSKTRKTQRKSSSWKTQSPGTHQRTIMLKKCGRKCFLGPNKSYPICTKNTCKVNPKGVSAAYKRSRQYHKSGISKRAKRYLTKMK